MDLYEIIIFIIQFNYIYNQVSYINLRLYVYIFFFSRDQHIDPGVTKRHIPLIVWNAQFCI